jgi:hypothetical protein
VCVKKKDETVELETVCDEHTLPAQVRDIAIFPPGLNVRTVSLSLLPPRAAVTLFYTTTMDHDGK